MLADLFRIRYDWDEGDWFVSVGSPGPIRFVRHYPTEQEAIDGEAELKRRLASAPDGNVESVLARWELEGLTITHS